MASNASACLESENSTDCLLRVLIQTLVDQNADEDAKFDWDPITFVFTVPIGLLAATLALVAVLQAVLAAGPGARKSNHRAIGRWAERTTREWNWRELNRLSLASTPVFRIDRTLKLLQDDSTRQSRRIVEARQRTEEDLSLKQHGRALSSWLSWLSAMRRLRVRGNPLGKAQTSAPPATWLRFLELGGLEDLDIDDDMLEVTAADYLPDDLQAVPAYAEVGFIVTMAAAAGAYTLRTDPQSPYPVILGSGFQFDFRQHPTLGTIGAFARYGTAGKLLEEGSADLLANVQPQWPPAQVRLRIAMMHAKGALSISRSPILSMDFLGRDSSAVIRATISTISGAIIENMLIHKCTDKHNSLCSTPPLDDSHHLYYLFVADTPVNPPVIFPSSQARVSNSLAILAMNSKFWSRPSKRLSEEQPSLVPSGRTNSPWLPVTWFARRFNLPEAVSPLGLNNFSLLLIPLQERWAFAPIRPKWMDSEPPSQWKADLEADLGDTTKMVAFPVVFEQSLAMLSGLEKFQAWFSSMAPLKRQWFRSLVLLQLQQLDEWLRHMARRKGYESFIQCRAITLYRTTLILLNAERGIYDGRFRSLRNYKDREAASEPRASAIDVPGWSGDIPSLHARTIMDVNELLEVLQDDHIPDIRRRQLATLLGYPNALHNNADGEKILSRLHSVVTPALEVIREETQAGKQLADDLGDELEVEEQRSTEEIVDDMIIWRCILMAMLLWTALDNSAIMASGVWEHVIPVI